MNEQKKYIAAMFLRNLRDAWIEAKTEKQNNIKGDTMNANKTERAHRGELTLKLIDQSDLSEREIKIKTNLTIDEVIRVVDSNIFNEGLSKDLLNQFQSKVKNFLEKMEDNIELLPLLMEVSETLAEAQKTNNENLLMIQRMKKDFKEKFGIDYDNESEVE